MKGNSIVGIAGKQGPFENVKKALSYIDLSCLQAKKVLIKPNIGRSAKIGGGYNTHPEAVAAIIESVLEAGALKVAIGESPLVGINTLEAFEKGGITDISKKYNVELIDFDSVKPVRKEIPNGRVLESTRICSPVFDFDFIISVPVAKTHMHTGVTLGLKNMKGCLYRHEKVRYHQLEYIDKVYADKTLDSAISDLATILTPDLSVIDGFIGMEGLGPSGGDAIQSDFAIASWSALAADVYGCILMNLNAQEIPHLRLISERLNLSLKPEDYEPLPAHFKDFIVPYRIPPKQISLEFKNTKIYDKESCSACLSTLMLFLRRFNDDMSPYFLPDGKFHVAIGKGVDDAPKGTVFIGNCSCSLKKGGIHVKGCPPVPTRIFEAITGNEPEENEPEVQ